MKKLLVVLVVGGFILGGCVRYVEVPAPSSGGSTTTNGGNTNSGSDLAQYYEVSAHPEGKAVVVAMFKSKLSSDRDDTWAAVLLGGFEVAYRHSNRSDQLAVGITYNDDSVEAYTVSAADWADLKSGRLTKEEFVNRIRKLKL